MLYIRRVGEVADGSVTASKIAAGAVESTKLADNAVDLSTAKVTGELPNTKLADNAVDANKIAANAVTEAKINNGAVTENKIANAAVVEAKLADLSVATGKLQNQAVTIAKAVQAMKIHHFIGDETEVSTTGTSEEGQKEFVMPRATSVNSGIQPAKLHINAEMKVTGASGATGTLKAYVDDEVSARITLNTTSDTYEMVEGNADISDLANGKHTITLKLVTDNAGATVYNDLVEIFFEK